MEVNPTELQLGDVFAGPYAFTGLLADHHPRGHERGCDDRRLGPRSLRGLRVLRLELLPSGSVEVGTDDTSVRQTLTFLPVGTIEIEDRE